ncbi:DsbA family oxidoreductase [Jannaschia sp. Os4]|uniref:DsbA family oxidoreductase n=1 Tax=Jannaschia sp. Os4 TaxID=2807617 RepID=UPI00193954F4|nr:DsbA family oxidoreductase [Jannaschia sp. Os4]MBM2577535.1 DsbA family oxidoreductase [Jannaschia sp. Os4]
MTTATIPLDILSDPICPWCLIGRARLFAALEQRPGHPFAIQWHPFQLNPDMPAEGMGRAAYLEAKFGGREGAMRAYAPIVETSEEMGLGIRFDAIQRTPNTLDAHRTIHWAGLEGKQTAMVDALFDAYFRKGRDIGDHAVLADLWAGAGLEREAVERLLATDADADDIRARDAHARERGVTGVPTFVVANQSAVVGAQPTETWLSIIDDIAAQTADRAPS